jgi:hypothetical protein
MEYLFVIICLFAAGFVALYLILRRIVLRLFDRAAQLDDIRREVEKMLVELNHTTSRNLDLVEERIGRLREMLETVDKRIGLLKRETVKTDGGAMTYSSLARKAPPPAVTPRPEREVITTYSLRDKVLSLHQAGFTAAMISAQLGSSIGEVELIISLSEKE